MDELKGAIERVEAEKGRKLTKNERNRLKTKLVKKKEPVQPPAAQTTAVASPKKVEYVSENLDKALSDASSSGVIGDQALEEFKDVFSKFAKPEELIVAETEEADEELAKGKEKKSGFTEEKLGDGDSDSDSNDSDEGSGEEGTKLSKKQMKQLTRMSVAELKQRVDNPELVESHDIAASDPEFLLYLKSHTKTVPVPKHWSQKRKYLHGGRGREKPPYQLPEFIAETGIAKIRDSLHEQDAAKKSKAKARERVRPSTGKIDIDYQVLHDAFFKYQTKPRMTGHGDIYYENKEYEYGSGVKDRKPGHMSARLLEALGVAPGSKVALNPILFCPPWLINQQRYGPPPSYPNLKIPGLNSPIPVAQGAQFGYHAGGWGKPPVDEYGQPIYGDVFGLNRGIDEGEDVVDRTRWAEFEREEEMEEEEDEDEDSDDEAEAALVGIQGAGIAAGSYKDIVPDTRGWTTDSTTGLPVPPKPQTGAGSGAGDVDAYLSKGTVDLRKRLAGEAAADEEDGEGGAPKQLYTVVKEKASSAQEDTSTLFGSAVLYEMGKQQEGGGEGGEGVPSLSKEKGGVEQSGDKGGEGEQPKKKRKRVEDSAAAKKLSDFKF